MDNANVPPCYNGLSAYPLVPCHRETIIGMTTHDETLCQLSHAYVVSVRRGDVVCAFPRVTDVDTWLKD